MAPDPVGRGELVKDSVKLVVDSQSGRFELFKQILTLSAAGLAGMAALLTDPSRIPPDYVSRVVVGWCAFFLAATLVVCLLGVSAYSNLLVAVARENTRQIEPLSQDKMPVIFEGRVVNCARITLGMLLLSGLGLLMFAGISIAGGRSTSIETAMDAAVRVVGQHVGSASTARVEHALRSKGEFNIDVRKELTGEKYKVRISREGAVLEIAHDPSS
jgi:hypothetical protein